ncbi:ArsR/SmtB family transcription factor [Nocardiopsis dassonvillei]|uniref:ArsR/SmtB family transcription factor n=1 Tax=Nocardiopsis dassonvillei TaxID=2014 RepID=UPI003F57EF3B
MSSHAQKMAALAALLADATRAGVCLALADGRAWTASELCRHTGVGASTMSAHLGRMVAGGVLVERRQGRHRYVALADGEITAVVEALAARAAPGVRVAPTLRAHRARGALARGRTCYDHLAGALGCGVAEAMVGRGLLTGDLGVTGAGREWFAELGAPLPERGRRPLARACLDWTERRSHLAGVAGAVLCAHVLDRGWCERVGSSRAVRLTPRGREALGAVLGDVSVGGEASGV